MSRAAGPSLWTATKLLLALRFRIAARRLSAWGAIGTVLAALIGLALAVAMGVASHLLFTRVPGVYASRIWFAFVTGLYFFLLGAFWIIWPVVAAQLDESYELGRFFRYPVRPAGLYLIRTLVALGEPAVLFFYPALLGATLGIADHLALPLAPIALLVGAYALMCVTGGRMLLSALLGVLKSRRSAEILFAAFLALLGLAAFLPPVDTSWLYERLGSFGGTSDDQLALARAAAALSDTPPGWLAYGLRAVANEHEMTALRAAAGMLVVAGLCWTVGLWLVKRFYRGGYERTRRTPPRPRRPAEARRGWRLPGVSGAVTAVFEKELKTLAGNPKGRMLFAVPFFLLILLKILGAPQLLRYLWGDWWTSYLLTALSVYVVAVLAGQFFANGFGYDGPGVRQVFTAPAPLGTWLVGRNLAQGTFATAQVLGLGVIAFTLLPRPSALGLLLPVCAFPLFLLVALAVGNILSATYPRRFHLSLARRDRPVALSFLWTLLSLSLCTLLCYAAIRLAAALGPGGRGAVLPTLPLVGALAYRALLPWAIARLSRGGERLLHEIAGG